VIYRNDNNNSFSLAQVTPASVIIANSLQRYHQYELEQRRHLIRIIAMVLAPSTPFSGLSIGITLLVLTGNVLAGVLIVACLLAALLYLTSYFMAHPRPILADAQINRACHFMLGSLLLIVSTGMFLLGANFTVTACFFFVPVLAGVIGLDTLAIGLYSIVAVVVVCIFYSLESIFKTYAPALPFDQYPVLALPTWVMIFGIVIVAITAFAKRIKKSSIELAQQSAHLLATLQTLQTLNSSANSMSQTVQSVTSELSAASHQQASGATEQASAITQASSSLQELGESSRQISNNINQIAFTAKQTLQLAYEVKVSSDNVSELTVKGRQALTKLFHGIDAVSNRIENLAQHLNDLTERSTEIGNIISLIREIADVTHLLALNAAIESAGNVGDSTGNMGRRFEAIASEVKHLADRSLGAARQVQTIITEVQAAIATAVLAAAAGKQETLDVEQEATTSNQVIIDLDFAVQHTLGAANDIVEASDTVATLADVINLATQQQQTAIEQILQTMQTMQQVAQENAAGAGQISQAISSVSDQAHELNDILAKSELDEVESILS
jgi:methyl-accepting chemotaxis protein